jgi:integrase/recombinase XerD
MTTLHAETVAEYALRHLRDDRHRRTRAAPVLNEWLAYLDVEGKAGSTLYNYERTIGALLRDNDKHVQDFTPEDINSHLARVPRKSRHISRSIINRFFLWAEFHDKIPRSPMGKVATIKKYQAPPVHTFTIPQVAALEALPAPDGQLFSILFGSGIRKAEARKLQRRDIDLDRRRLIVRRGKGGKGRIVALTPGALKAVVDLDFLENLSPDDYLWSCRPGGGNMISRRFAIGDSTFSTWYTRCLDRAGVPYLSPHKTRHTYHELLRKFGLTLEERQVLMGHKSIRTTVDQYGHVDPDETAEKLREFDLEAL